MLYRHPVLFSSSVWAAWPTSRVSRSMVPCSLGMVTAMPAMPPEPRSTEGVAATVPRRPDHQVTERAASYRIVLVEW